MMHAPLPGAGKSAASRDQAKGCQRIPSGMSEQHPATGEVDGSGNLPPTVARTMEGHFGTSFADVKVHADESAARDALDRGAAAYTKGSHIYFGHGQYRPSSIGGQRLIAHELAHVIQQRNGRAGAGSGDRATAVTDRLEEEAERAASAWRPGAGQASRQSIAGHAQFGAAQFSLLGDLADMRSALRGGMRSAARWVLAHLSGDALIDDLGHLLGELSALRVVRLPRPVIAAMEDRLAWARSVAPAWLPIPSISFRGDGAQGVAVVDDVAIAAVLLFIACLIVLLWLLRRANPATRRADDEAVEELIRKIREGVRRPPQRAPNPDSDAEQDPDPRPRPDQPPRPVPLPCPFPTGLSPLDPIPIKWHKIPSLYASPIQLDGHDYARDNPTTLPRGEPIGIPDRFWPSFGKIVQLAPERRGSAAADFRAVLESYGFDWVGRRYLQAEHAQDLQWAAPDGENLDVFNNLWPYDGAGNMSAGATQNMWQRVTFCETPIGPPNVNVTIQSVKRPGGYGRYFVIRSVGMPE